MYSTGVLFKKGFCFLKFNTYETLHINSRLLRLTYMIFCSKLVKTKKGNLIYIKNREIKTNI